MSITKAFFFNKNNTKINLNKQKPAERTLPIFFALFRALVGRVIFNYLPNKVVIQLIYFLPEKKKKRRFKRLGNWYHASPAYSGPAEKMMKIEKSKKRKIKYNLINEKVNKLGYLITDNYNDKIASSSVSYLSDLKPSFHAPIMPQIDNLAIYSLINNKDWYKRLIEFFSFFYQKEEILEKGKSINKSSIPFFPFSRNFLEKDKSMKLNSYPAIETLPQTLQSWVGQLQKQGRKDWHSSDNISEYPYKLPLALYSKEQHKKVELRFIRIKYPNFDSRTLAQLIGMNSHKYNFLILYRWLLKKRRTPIIKTKYDKDYETFLFNNSNKFLPSYLSGIKVQISGRISSQRVIPRKTINVAYKGSYGKRENTILDKNQYTAKNRIGAFNVKIIIGSRFINEK